MRCALLSLIICSALAAQNVASIDGIVIDITTHQPLPGVHITLRSDSPDTWGAISTKEGKFSITALPPEIYFLAARRSGYIQVPEQASDEDSEVSLSAGQHRTGFIVRMTPRAAIAGRVTDEYGDPVRGVSVQAIPADARRPADIFGMDAGTDERGQYRMTVLPGAYYIKASKAGVVEYSPAEVRSDSPAPAYAATWYPSAIRQDQAAVVEAAAGRDANGIDIRLVRTLSLSVSGLVTGQQSHSASVSIWPAGGGIGSLLSSRKFIMVGADGNFRAYGLTPGRYLIAAGSDTLQSPRQEVSLQATDITGLTLNMTPGEELSGTLKIEGGAQPGPEQFTVQLQPHSGDGLPDASTPTGGSIDHEGAFRLEQVFPGKFRVSVVPMPENAYVKSVKFDSTESPDDWLDLPRGVGGGRLAVLLNLNGGRVEGTVTDAEGKPIDDPRPFVALGNSMQRSETGGRFRFTGVRPGKYRLVAIDPREYNNDPDVLGKTLPNAVEFEVGEGSRIERNITITAVEKPVAK